MATYSTTTFRLEVDQTGLRTGLSSAERRIAGTDSTVRKRFDGLGRSIATGLGRMAVTGAAAAGAGIAAIGVASVKAAMEAQAANAQTVAALKSTEGASNMTKKGIQGLAEKIMMYSGMSDEAVQGAENLLLTFTKVRNESGKGNKIFTQGTKAIADMSVAMDVDLSSAALTVGKALNDPTKGMTALSRAGVQFTESQKKTIEKMQESGDLMGAQKIILKELETQFGGSAKAAGKTFGGQLKILWEIIGNVMEKVGKALIPVLKDLAGWMREKLPDAIKVVKGWLKSAAKWWNEYGDDVIAIAKWLWERLKDIWGTIVEVVRGAINTVRGIVKTVTALLRGDWKTAWEGVKETLRGIWDTIVGLVSGKMDAVREKIGNVIETIKEKWRTAWSSVKEFFGDIWDSIATKVGNVAGSILRGVVGFVNKIITAINWVRDKFGMDPLPYVGESGGETVGSGRDTQRLPPGRLQRNKGGPIPGVGDTDSVDARLTPGEFVIRKRAVERIGLTKLLALNRADNSQTFRNAHRELYAGEAGDPRSTKFGKARFFAAGGPVFSDEQIARAQKWAWAQKGKPYVWGAAGPSSFDCSGLQSNILSLLTGRPMNTRLFTTRSIGPGVAGLERGPGQFMIGNTAGGGHMGGTVGGLEVETGGNPEGVEVGPTAEGALDSAFNEVFHLGSADGGSFASKFMSGFLNSLPGAGIIKAFGQMVSSAKDLAGAAFDHFVDVPKIPGALADLPGKLYAQSKGWLEDWIGEQGSGLFGGGAGGVSMAQYAGQGGAAAASQAIQQAMRIVKTEGGGLPSWITLPKMMQLARSESNFDPNARAYTTVASGQRALGLLQTIPSTFSAYTLPGYGNIFNPVHNAIASMGYIKARYGPTFDFMAPYHDGGIVGPRGRRIPLGDAMVHVQEGETILPRGGRGGGSPINVTVNIRGSVFGMDDVEDVVVDAVTSAVGRRVPG